MGIVLKVSDGMMQGMIRPTPSLLILAATSCVAASAGLSPLPPAADQPVDFVRDIRPIFAHACLKCHGPEKQKGDYRLDSASIALTKGGSHAPNILPGRSAESPLIHFVAGLDGDMQMPPKGPPLHPEQIGLLRRWIDDGAVWPEEAGARVDDRKDWWSLKPVIKPPVPAGQSNGNSIDAFTAAKLREKDLTMAPPADARTLIRRVYFDLTGLPPTPGEVEDFVKASVLSGTAYETLVDKLLASPRYGERWARHWLDVVHFGETHGYDKDQPRPNAWPYRDYVIRAFNGDKPYERFVQEQLAGDVLFPDTRDGIEALGFISAGPWDLIGHAEVPEEKIDGKIARHLDRDDMVANTIGTFTSVTVQCAQCHDHKFDPITQGDYYSLQAVFAALDRADQSYDVDPALKQKRRVLTEKVQNLEREEKALAVQLAEMAGPDLARLEAEIREAGKAAAPGAKPEYGWHSQIEKAQETRKWVQIDLGQTTLLDQVVLTGVWDDFNGIGAGFGFPVRFRIEASGKEDFTGEPVVIAAQDLEDFPNPGTAPQRFSAKGKSGRYLRVTITKLALRQNDYAAALAEVQVFDTTGKNLALGAKVTSMDSIEAPVRWRLQNLTDGIYPATAGGEEKLASLRQQRDDLIAKALDGPAKAARTSNAAALEGARNELARLPAMQVVYSGTVHHGSGNFKGTSGRPRAIHLLARGQVTLPRAEMQPAALAACNDLLPAAFDLAPGAPEGARRAALAQWITDKRNPLTYRSIVNRVWLYHFGNGLVTTANDFGRMGLMPTHPELLDWLAATFRDDLGGSMKKLHRLIVTSATYRQSSSVANGRAAEIDSGNSLLWRMNRRKLEAEALRDAVLAASGKLDLTPGGPGWKDFVVERPEHSPHYQYNLADPSDPTTWRRAVYRFLVRSQPQPFMTVLDCADPSMRVEKRNESVSPSQALALLNNGFMVVQATHFAARLKAEAGDDPAAQMDLAIRIATGRRATPQERDQLCAFINQHGLANACRVIFNLNEFTFID